MNETQYFYNTKIPVTQRDRRFVEQVKIKLRQSGRSMSEVSRAIGATPSYVKKIVSFHSRPSMFRAFALMEELGFSERQQKRMEAYAFSLYAS